MSKFNQLKVISNQAARQASEDCASKIEKLTDSQLNTVIEELRNSGANDNEVAELLRIVQLSTDKNKAIRNFIHKSEQICQAVADIIGGGGRIK